MTRTHFSFSCEGSQLAASCDHADGDVGLLIISGGNELRSGAFAGHARIARDISTAGYPVFRFDRRGVGDSEGANHGFEDSSADVAAAIQAFRDAHPSLGAIVGFGNCDAASALMLQSGAGFDALVLSNPWTFDGDDEPDAMPAQAIRSRYLDKLRSPAEIKRLLTGGVSFTKLLGGLKRAVASEAPEPTGLTEKIRFGVDQFSGKVRFLLAERDRTAQAFLAHWDESDARIRKCPNATHAYVEPEAYDWLVNQLVDILSGEHAR